MAEEKEMLIPGRTGALCSPQGVCASGSPECGKKIAKAFERYLCIAYFQISIWGYTIDKYNSTLKHNWGHVVKFFGDGTLEQKHWKNVAVGQWISQCASGIPWAPQGLFRGSVS